VDSFYIGLLRLTLFYLLLQFVAKSGKELLTFFSSQNLEIAQRLAPPPVLVGLANTVLLMRVQIINSNGYANAVMEISPAI